MTLPIIALAADFPPPTEADWIALVDKTLAGADFTARLTSRTADGLVIQPLYTAQTSASAPVLLRAATHDPMRAWDLRCATDHPDPVQANIDVLTDLEGGAASVSLRLDPSGREGIAVAGPDDLARVLDSVLLDLAPVALDAGFMGGVAAGWLGRLAKGAPSAPLAFNLDPLGAFARAGASPGAMTAILERDTAQATELAQTYPQATLFVAGAEIIHDAGGSEAQELGFGLACALCYARALSEAGLPIEAAFAATALRLAADADYFLTLAKLRAARLLAARLAAACGAATAPKIEARSARRMLSRLDPWVNLLRLTTAAFGAALGGADVIQLDPFTQPLGRPSALARRQARNAQLVLMEEGQLGQVTDAAAGSWFIDDLTDQLARAGWAAFQAIEAEGGALASLSAGRIAERVAAARQARASDIARRKTPLIGVSQYASLAPTPVAFEQPDETAFAKPGPDLGYGGDAQTCAPLQAIRLAEPFEALRERAAGLATPEVFLATLGEDADAAPRVGFIRGLCEVGGLAARTAPPGDYRADQYPLAVLCGSDAAYGAHAADAAAALKAAGAVQLWLAGRPSDAFVAAGVDGFAFSGADVVTILDQWLSLLEAAR